MTNAPYISDRLLIVRARKIRPIFHDRKEEKFFFLGNYTINSLKRLKIGSDFPAHKCEEVNFAELEKFAEIDCSPSDTLSALYSRITRKLQVEAVALQIVGQKIVLYRKV